MALDKAIGSNYVNQSMSLRGTAASTLATRIKILCLTFHVGLLVIDEIQKGIKRGDASQAIHCIWYCVGAPSRRFEQAEIDFLQKLLHGIESFRVPVIVVLTQSYDIEVAKKLKSAIEKENLAIAKVVPVLAENYILTINDEKYTAKAFGLDKLSEVMNYVVPEAHSLLYRRQILN